MTDDLMDVVLNRKHHDIKFLRKEVEKMARAYKDTVKIPGWTTVTVSLSPEILKEAQRFSKEHTLIMSQLVNSAIKVFISEAEAHFKEQAKRREENQFMNLVQKTPKNAQPFRTYDVFTTKDALKARK